MFETIKRAILLCQIAYIVSHINLQILDCVDNSKTQKLTTPKYAKKRIRCSWMRKNGAQGLWADVTKLFTGVINLAA